MLSRLNWRPVRNEEAQILPIMALLVVVLIALIGLAVDMGRVYVARAQLARAVDAAALAGVVDLPNVTTAQQKATVYLVQNQSNATISFPVTSAQYQLKIAATRDINMIFMPVVGIHSITIHANATAGYGVVPLDAAMVIDATGSMGASPCNGSQNNSGCPIWEAKNAAKSFTDTLLSSTGSSNTLVGALPFRGCYNPPRTDSNCVPTSQITQLGSNATTVTNGINNITSQGGTGTNVCLGLYEAYNQVLMGTGHHTQSNTLRFIILLTDGDNTWNAASYGNGAPPSTCQPSNPSSSDGDVSSNCSSAQTHEMQMDTNTQNYATTLGATNGVEIYVVGFGVCGTSNTTTCNTSLIGGSSHDDTADRNLLKCIASSSPGTNDHYYETATASSLPSIFTQIAQAIAFRLIE